MVQTVDAAVWFVCRDRHEAVCVAARLDGVGDSPSNARVRQGAERHRPVGFISLPLELRLKALLQLLRARERQLERRERGLMFLDDGDFPVLPEWESQIRQLEELREEQNGEGDGQR